MTTKITWTIILISFLIFHSGLSQQRQSSGELEENDELVEDENTQIIELTFDLVGPVADFSNSLNKSIYGVTGAFYTQTRSEQYSHYGLQASFYRIGELTNTVTNGVDEPFTDTTSSNAVFVRFLYRRYAPFYLPRVEPFMEVAIGPHVFYTSTNTVFFDEEGSSSLSFDETDFGLSYALTIGTTVQIVDRLLGVIKVGYNGGTATSYLVPNEELQTAYPIDSFVTEVDRPSYFSFNIGAAFLF